ncbi:MAG: ribosome maturation factor RimM [Gammaproteobacteria bacterium]|jgi:16S rRNA processing protein RimM
MNADTTQDMVKLGYISGVFGVKGWVKVYSDTEPRENILNYSPWYLYISGQWQARKVLAGRLHNKGLVVQLEGCNDRDLAATLVKTEIAITRDQLPRPAPGEYYWQDLIGLQVMTEDEVNLGKITDLMETGANDVLVVKAENGRERLIPFIRDDVVTQIDLETGTMRVDWDPEF